MTICPIWQKECHFECPSKGAFVGGSRAPMCDCICAGGKFECASPQLLAGLNGNAKVLVSGWIARENLVHGNVPLVDQDTLHRAISRPMPTVPECLNLALEWLIINSEGRIGVRPLGDLYAKFPRFMAFSCCRNHEEADAVLLSLEQDELVQIPLETIAKRDIRTKTTVPHTKRTWHMLWVTPKGFAHHEELRKSVDSSRAFVAMWFGKDMDAVYDEAIAPAVRAAGYEPVRVDRVDHLGKIDDEIIAQIRRARFVVADFTAADLEKPRGGVYYEAGFAYGLGREVIYTCRADFVEALHFDTRQFNHLVWEADNLPDFRRDLQNRIERAIGQGPKLPEPKGKTGE